MIITRLTLKSFKSYESAEIPLAEGANAIIGANGAGKSTLLEALGFVLFDAMPAGFTLANLLREGAASGGVIVRLISSLDEREYEVERQFSATTTTRYRVYDPELGRAVLVEGREDVLAWLHDHLRLEPTAKLSELFENTIGVPQGAFTAPFLQAGAARKAIFDPLLQVDDYRKARDSLLDTVRHLDGKLHQLAERIARAEGELAALPTLEREEEALQDSLAELETRLQRLYEASRVADEQLARLDAAERHLTEARQRLSQAHAERTAQQRRLEDAQRALATAEQARLAMQAAEPAHVAFLAAEEQVEALEQQRVARDGLVTQRAKLDQEQARHVAQSEAARRALEEIDAAACALETLEPLATRQTELETALRQAEQERTRWEAALRREREIAAQLNQAEAELSEARAGLERAQALDVETAAHQALAAAQRLAARQAAECAAAAAGEQERLQEQNALLETTEEGARCPTCEAELTPEHRAELLARNHVRLEELALDIAASQAAATQADRQASAAERQAQQAQRARTRLPGEGAVADAERRYAQATDALATAQAELARLAEAPERVAQLQGELKNLGNPRSERDGLAARLAQRPSVEAQRRQAEEALGQNATRLAELAASLEPYAELDVQLAAARAERAQHAEGHNAYLTNQKEAAQVAQRQAVATALAEDVARLAVQEDALAQAEEVAGAVYDAEAHRVARERAMQARADVAAACAQQGEQQTRLDRVQAQCTALRRTAADLEDLRAQRVAAQRLLGRVQWVRDLLGKAGPLVTEQLVRRISQEASSLYADIMGDHSNHLTWAQDYELSLEVDGRKRLFRQLSGGEQMCAALAVRLALLHEMSAIDVAFFDEPTTNLDAERREGLAERIMQVRGFRQIFVISHDDTFERAAQSFVHIVKDERGSRIEGQLC